MKKDALEAVLSGTPSTLLKTFRVPYDLWHWYKAEAEEASKAAGKRIGTQTLMFAVLRRYKEEAERLKIDTQKDEAPR